MQRGIRVKDIAGQQFGRLTVLSLDSIRQRPLKRRGTLWLCQCTCGAKCIVRGTHLQSGNSQSCGCMKRELARELASTQNTTHGHARGSISPTYSVWIGMRKRCQNKATNGYLRYGGRGISVCERWHKFENFLADMGERPPGRTLDRINNDGNYEPGNCRWATLEEQNLNRPRLRKKGAMTQK